MRAAAERGLETSAHTRTNGGEGDQALQGRIKTRDNWGALGQFPVVPGTITSNVVASYNRCFLLTQFWRPQV